MRNELAYMRFTLDSVLGQTLLPDRWIIVDDGSSDGSSEVLESYALRHDRITILKRQDHGGRRLGGGVVEAFNDGLSELGGDLPEFICKLDMDLLLPPRYFEELIDEMSSDVRLGSVSGKPYFLAERDDLPSFHAPMRSERIADDVSAGMTKLYRRAFLNDIGGLVKGLLWDGIDCYRGRMYGWRSRSINRPSLRFLHLRPMGSSDANIGKGRRRLGEGYWFMGASPIFVLASAIYRLTHPPKIVGSINMLLGFAGAAITNKQRYGDMKFRRYIRGYQWQMLVRGRAAAMRRAEDKGEAAWIERHRAGAETCNAKE